ncbi:MAG: hypothetical protein HQ515_10035 [Phycisphaeraceae bacterium]|nr:hypothetical protein [Phycisphaeraceae bacterium]
MLKDFGILLGGVFVGAVVMEIVRKKCPKVGATISKKVGCAGQGLKEAFKAGYESVKQSSAPAEEDMADAVEDLGVDPA